MCIFCGGVCGGAVDVLLPSIVAGAGLVVLKIQAIRVSSKGKSREKPQGEAVESKSAPEQNRTD